METQSKMLSKNSRSTNMQTRIRRRRVYKEMNAGTLTRRTEQSGPKGMASVAFFRHNRRGETKTCGCRHLDRQTWGGKPTMDDDGPNNWARMDFTRLSCIDRHTWATWCAAKMILLMIWFDWTVSLLLSTQQHKTPCSEVINSRLTTRCQFFHWVSQRSSCSRRWEAFPGF